LSVFFGLMLCLALPAKSSAQMPLDQRLIGTWIKAGSGDRIEIKPNGDINLLLSGPAAPFSGLGSVERCTAGGANLCITGPRIHCDFRYEFVGGGLNLQFRSGDKGCSAISGDLKRPD
jgi:hypothetical protein